MSFNARKVDEFQELDPKLYLEIENPDKLDEMFEKQFQLQLRFGEPVGTKFNQEYINRTITCLIDEARELHNTTPWKTWKNNQHLDVPAYKEEVVDVLCYAMNLFVAAGMDSHDVYSSYMAKNTINFERFNIGRNKRYSE